MIVGLPITNEMEHESIQARRYSCAIPTGQYTQSHIDSNRPQSTGLAADTHPSSSTYVSNASKLLVFAIISMRLPPLLSNVMK